MGKRNRHSASVSVRDIFLFLLVLVPAGVFAQAASRTDGTDVLYYATLQEAVETAGGGSLDAPDEILLLSDIIVNEPIIVGDNIHIRLVPAGGGRTVLRGGGNLEYPLFWLSGDNASLSLGKPGMEYGLVIDGGYLNNPPIEALSPLVDVNGADSKLIMYDNVVLQNNCNASIKDSFYNFGGGVYVRPANDLSGQKPEFIMKGGIISGNINKVKHTAPYGGGVLVRDMGIFTMEGGVIMNNTAQRFGGGVHISSRSIFKKTGGIIYGANAPEGVRNTAIDGVGSPKIYGHAVCTGSVDIAPLHYRDDTVRENDNLSYTGTPTGPGVFGKGEKWDNPDKVFMRRLLIGIIPVALAGAAAALIIMKRARTKRLRMASAQGQAAIADLNLSPREKEIFDLLLTDMAIKQIAGTLNLTNSGVTFHSQNIYRKLGIKTRTELLVKYK